MREKYYVFLALSLIGIIGLSMIGPIYLGRLFFPAWILGVAAVAFGASQFRCRACGHALVRPRTIIGAREITGYTSFPGRCCTWCDSDVDG